MKASSRLALYACALMPLLCSCGSEGPDGPSVSFKDITVEGSFVYFTFDCRNSDLVAYTTVAASGSAAAPSAEDLFLEGSTILPGYSGCRYDLEEGTEYVIYAASADADGNRSPVVSHKFTPAAKKRISFNVSFVNYSTVALKNIVPDDMGKRYIAILWSGPEESMLESYGISDLAELPQKMFDEGKLNEYNTVTGILTGMYTGDISIWMQARPDSDVCLVAWYVNDDYSPASPAECTVVHTLPVPDRVPLELSMDKVKVGDTGCEITLTSNVPPTGLSVSPLYFDTWSGVRFFKASLFRDCTTARDTAQCILDYFGEDGLGTYCTVSGTMTGNIEFRDSYGCNCYPSYTPGETYVTAVFGCCGSKITTQPYIYSFVMPDDGKGDSVPSVPSGPARQ